MRRNNVSVEKDESDGLTAFDLRTRFHQAVTAAGGSMDVGLNREQFKALVASLLASDKPSRADLDTAFKLADVDESGSVDVYEFIKLFKLIADGAVKGMGQRKSFFSGSAIKKKRADFQARLKLSNSPLQPGDQVTWKGADADLPFGTVGTVLCVHDDDSGDVEVLFYSPTAGTEATFTFRADRLAIVNDATTTVPVEDPEARAARKREAYAQLAVFAEKSESRATQAKEMGALKARKVILERQTKAEKFVAAKLAKEALDREKAAKIEAEKESKRFAEEHKAKDFAARADPSINVNRGRTAQPQKPRGAHAAASRNVRILSGPTRSPVSRNARIITGPARGRHASRNNSGSSDSSTGTDSSDSSSSFDSDDYGGDFLGLVGEEAEAHAFLESLGLARFWDACARHGLRSIGALCDESRASNELMVAAIGLSSIELQVFRLAAMQHALGQLSEFRDNAVDQPHKANFVKSAAQQKLDVEALVVFAKVSQEATDAYSDSSCDEEKFRNYRSPRSQLQETLIDFSNDERVATTKAAAEAKAISRQFEALAATEEMLRVKGERSIDELMREIERVTEPSAPNTPEFYDPLEAKALFENKKKKSGRRGQKSPRASPVASEKKKVSAVETKKTEQQKRVEEQDKATLEKRKHAEAAEKERLARRVEQGIRLKEELAAKEEARYQKLELARRKAAADEFKMELALAKRLKQQQAKRNVPEVASAPLLGVGATYSHIVQGARALVKVEVPSGERPGFAWTDGGAVIKVNAGKRVALAGTVAVGWRLCAIDGKPVGPRAAYDAVKQRLNGVKASNKPYTLAFEPPPTTGGEVNILKDRQRS